MIVTGFAADGSTTVGPEVQRNVEGVSAGSSQHLANPPTPTPQRDFAVLEWLKRRAGADTQMQQAASARTAEPPPVRGASETDDVVSAIGWDHNQVKYLLEELEAIPGVRQGARSDQQHERAAIVDMIRARLSEHETVEEQYFWPAVRQLLPQGNELADRGIAQEHEGNEHLQAMSGADGTEETFDEQVEKLVLLLRRHVAFEDRVLLEFSRTVPGDTRRQIGHSYLNAKRHASTDSDPHAPNSKRSAKQKGHGGPEPGASPEKDRIRS